MASDRTINPLRAYREDKHLLLAILDLAPLQAVRGHNSVGLALPGHQVFEPLLSFLQKGEMTKARRIEIDAATRDDENLSRNNCQMVTEHDPKVVAQGDAD